MSQFHELLSSIQKETYSTKGQLLEYLLRMLQQIKQPTPEDRQAILEYAFGEVDAMLLDIPRAANYREKDRIFACEDLILGIIMALCPSPSDIPEKVLAKIQILVQAVARERIIETCIERLFALDSITETQIRELLSLAGQPSDEYQKGRLYAGLVHFKDCIDKITPRGKDAVGGYLKAELARYLNMEQLDEDCIGNLELAADVCRYFLDEELVCLLRQLLNRGYGNINYYITESLLFAGEELSSEAIQALSADLGYANLTYELLSRYGKADLFPRECATEEYLAKSDLVHWLLYPTELGQAPDEIEYIGKIKYLFKKEVYHVFRFRSSSDTLSEDLKGKWLIGWSSNEGGTFSNFDEYAVFEKGSTEATLKNIKKKLIG